MPLARVRATARCCARAAHRADPVRGATTPPPSARASAGRRRASGVSAASSPRAAISVIAPAASSSRRPHHADERPAALARDRHHAPACGMRFASLVGHDVVGEHAAVVHRQQHRRALDAGRVMRARRHRRGRAAAGARRLASPKAAGSSRRSRRRVRAGAREASCVTVRDAARQLGAAHPAGVAPLAVQRRAVARCVHDARRGRSRRRGRRTASARPACQPARPGRRRRCIGRRRRRPWPIATMRSVPRDDVDRCSVGRAGTDEPVGERPAADAEQHHARRRDRDRELRAVGCRPAGIGLRRSAACSTTIWPAASVRRRRRGVRRARARGRRRSAGAASAAPNAASGAASAAPRRATSAGRRRAPPRSAAPAPPRSRCPLLTRRRGRATGGRSRIVDQHEPRGDRAAAFGCRPRPASAAPRARPSPSPSPSCAPARGRRCKSDGGAGEQAHGHRRIDEVVVDLAGHVPADLGHHRRGRPTRALRPACRASGGAWRSPRSAASAVGDAVAPRNVLALANAASTVAGSRDQRRRPRLAGVRIALIVARRARERQRPALADLDLVVRDLRAAAGRASATQARSSSLSASIISAFGILRLFGSCGGPHTPTGKRPNGRARRRRTGTACVDAAAQPGRA